MYDLDNAVTDFPWTKVVYNGVEPWRKIGSGWFHGIPKGWGDVIYEYLVKLDKILKQYNLMEYLYIEQVKEKYGSLRWYNSFCSFDMDMEFTKKQEVGIKLFNTMVWELEGETEKVCCDCGTTENVECYGGWVHFACPECESKRKKEWQEAVEAFKKAKEGDNDDMS